MGVKEAFDSAIDFEAEVEKHREKVGKNLVSKLKEYGIEINGLQKVISVKKGFFELCDYLGITASEIPPRNCGFITMAATYNRYTFFAIMPEDKED